MTSPNLRPQHTESWYSSTENRGDRWQLRHMQRHHYVCSSALGIQPYNITISYLFYWGSMPPCFPSLRWHLKAALRDSCYWLGHPIVTTSCLRFSVTSVSSQKTAHFSHSLLTWSTLHNRAGSFHAKLIYYPNIHRHEDTLITAACWRPGCTARRSSWGSPCRGPATAQNWRIKSEVRGN